MCSTKYNNKYSDPKPLNCNLIDNRQVLIWIPYTNLYNPAYTDFKLGMCQEIESILFYLYFLCIYKIYSICTVPTCLICFFGLFVYFYFTYSNTIQTKFQLDICFQIAKSTTSRNRRCGKTATEGNLQTICRKQKL